MVDGGLGVSTHLQSVQVVAVLRDVDFSGHCADQIVHCSSHRGGLGDESDVRVDDSIAIDKMKRGKMVKGGEIAVAGAMSLNVWQPRRT